MIEFEIQAAADQRSLVALNANTILIFEPSGPDRCLVTLTNGRQLLATVPYERIRRLVIEARSSFATTVANNGSDD
jgi:hypothetical protein